MAENGWSRVVDPDAGEVCDDGNLTSGDGCEPYCATCDPSAPPFASTWTALATRIFVRQRCDGCHGSARIAGLDLRPDVAYANLVGVPARTVAGLARVAPGDPAGSLLWNVLAKGNRHPRSRRPSRHRHADRRSPERR